MPKRKKTGPLRWHQHHGRNGSRLPATATTKKTNRNNNNNDDDCNTTDLIDLQDVCSKQVRPFRFAVELYNTGGDGDGDKGSVIIQF